MNEEIKYLLNYYNISPPPTVQTEEEVVEYVLELYSDLQKRVELIQGIAERSGKVDQLIVESSQYRLVS